MARNVIAVFASAALAFGGTVVFSTTAHAAPGDPVVFADVNLANAVNDALGQPHGTAIIEGDAATLALTSLTAENAGITDLGGIQHLTELTSLNLGENSISDVSLLSGLTKLTDLHLYDNSISDVSPLTGLTDLITLVLNGNSISDVSPLSGLTNLTVLGLDDNSISTLPVLTGLTSLTDLYLNVNSISDVSPLSGLTNLTGLHLNTNSVSDVLPLSGLTGLTELYLHNNSISDVSPLSGLTNLDFLGLSGQSVSMSPGVVSQSTANPVVDAAGAAVPVSSTDAAFVFDAALNEWMFTTVGTKTLTWSTSVTVGNAPATQFSGTMTQAVNEAELARSGADPVMTIFGGVLGSLLLLAGATAVAARRRITAH